MTMMAERGEAAQQDEMFTMTEVTPVAEPSQAEAPRTLRYGAGVLAAVNGKGYVQAPSIEAHDTVDLETYRQMDPMGYDAVNARQRMARWLARQDRQRPNIVRGEE